MTSIPEERHGFTAPEPILQQRRILKKALASNSVETPVTAQTTALANVAALQFSSPSDKRGTVLHFHGGGFRLGQPELCTDYAARLTEHCQVDVICPAYRLAPEHPFPAGILDGVAAIKALALSQQEAPLFVSGDSAGGGIAAAATLLALEQGIAIAGVILLSPWLDLTVTADTYVTNADNDTLFSQDSAKACAELYLQGESAHNCYASPLFANLHHFPPSLICTGNVEVLLEDSRQFARRLSEAGRTVSFQEIAGMEHIAAVRNINATGARQAADAIYQFILQRLDSNASQ